MNRDWWHGKRVLIDGAHGFLGTHLGRALNSLGVVYSEPLGDLCDPLTSLHTFGSQDVVFHLAAKVGGIGYNASHPAEIIHNNLLVDANVVHAAATRGVGKLVCVGSTCAYPANAPTPIREESFWNGNPEPTNAAYAHAKRALYANLYAHQVQYGLNFAYLVLANLYGEGQSDDAQNSHVIPALIRKVLDTSTPTISAWGTGSAVREFLHVSDAVNALILAAENPYYYYNPINIGSGESFSIRETLDMIRHLAGDTRTVAWDLSKPNGQASRRLDIRLAWDWMGYKPQTSLATGLRELVERKQQNA